MVLYSLKLIGCSVLVVVSVFLIFLNVMVMFVGVCMVVIVRGFDGVRFCLLYIMWWVMCVRWCLSFCLFGGWML